MREVKTYAEFAEWRRTSKPGERVLYDSPSDPCDADSLRRREEREKSRAHGMPVSNVEYHSRDLNRDIAIENAILEAKDIKVSGMGLIVLTKKHLRGRGKGSRPHRQSPYTHTAGASSIGAKKPWRDPPTLSDEKSGELFETFRQKMEGPMTNSRDDRAVWDHVTAWARDGSVWEK